MNSLVFFPVMGSLFYLSLFVQYEGTCTADKLPYFASYLGMIGRMFGKCLMINYWENIILFGKNRRTSVAGHLGAQ